MFQWNDSSPDLHLTIRQLSERGMPGKTLTLVGKMYIVTFLTFMISACNGDQTPDCFQNGGDIIREEVLVPDFNKITVFENIELILKNGPTQKVEIETGEFLREEVRTEVKDGRLIVTDGNNCNLFRAYGSTKIYVTSPGIEEIRSSTGFPIRSDGPLSYDSLTLYSESFIAPEAGTTDGSFDLELASQNVNAIVNGIAFLRLRGTTVNLTVNIAAGDSRIEAGTLSAENVSLNHRGSNDIVVNPQQTLSGIIRGTGDVVSRNRPPTVEVEELYTGRLIFQN